MAKIKLSEALAQLPENTATALNHIVKQNLSDDFLVDLDEKKIYINFPEPQKVLDIYATGATLDPETLILSVQRENGEPFTVDLAKLAESQIHNEATSAVTLLGKGTKTEPFSADVKISQNEGNQLSKDEQGALFVPAYEPPAIQCLMLRDVFGQALGENGTEISVVLCSTQSEPSSH